MKKNRMMRGFVAVGLTLGLALTSTSAFAETWRMAVDQSLESPEGKGVQRFADLVKEYSGGDLTIQLFPFEQLGKTDAVMEQLASNVIQIQSAGLVRLIKWNPDIAYMNAPFMFEGRDHWVRFMHSDLVKGWFDGIAEKAHVAVLGDPTIFLRGPYRVMVSTKPVQTIDDLSGLRLRMHPDDLAVEAWKYLGCDVRIMAWSEVYQGLSRSMIDAVNSPISLVESTRFQEAAKNVAEHDEYWQSVGFMMNTDAYAALSEKDQQALQKAYVEASAYGTELVENSVDDSIKRMKEEGVTFGKMETGPMVARMQQFYDEKDAAGALPEGFLAAVAATRSAQ
ncbi:TRAP transporter substrate-binding protein [Rhodobium gokarnense]|uniref:TRAP-type C4-dicarboxylate transport system substrate-binding protein n=1 Tax=Rhodobium gokarnense TaxID=364296 RepID=A0ABT3HBF9_9HYPH|nr:TRAP transporter substrate-binding protein [Rhodobium gokarnense]MCW2307679.1 TRAP-type C4-dicarboxylate transport system substrate-binding protein [Rhodobium gokarnense]